MGGATTMVALHSNLGGRMEFIYFQITPNREVREYPKEAQSDSEWLSMGLWNGLLTCNGRQSSWIEFFQAPDYGRDPGSSRFQPGYLSFRKLKGLWKITQ